MWLAWGFYFVATDYWADVVAAVAPVVAGVRGGAAYRAVAALFVHKAALDAPSPPEAIQAAMNR